jgi:hypothetical protein
MTTVRLPRFGAQARGGVPARLRAERPRLGRGTSDEELMRSLHFVRHISGKAVLEAVAGTQFRVNES